MKLPKLTQKEILYVDATPDEGYPLRILEAYRHNCNTFWDVYGLTKKERIVYALMNEHQKQRIEILDKAIKILQKEK